MKRETENKKHYVEVGLEKQRHLSATRRKQIQVKSDVHFPADLVALVGLCRQD